MQFEEEPLPTDPRTHLVKALDLLPDVICIVDVDGRFVALSAACEQVFGYLPEELIGTPMIDLVFPADRQRTQEAAAGVMLGITLRNFENRYVRKDGRVIDIMWSARWSPDDRVRLAVAREITQRKRAEAMQLALHRISEAAYTIDFLADLCCRIQEIARHLLPPGRFLIALQEAPDLALEIACQAGESMATSGDGMPDALGIATAMVRGGVVDVLAADAPAAWPAALAGTDSGECDWLGIPLVVGRRTGGALVVQSAAATQRYDPTHRMLLQFIATQVVAAIERRQANARLQYLAQYDILTGLPNRALFDDRLRVALSRAARAGERVALLYLDLDNFKPVNDTHGHAVGDLLLQQIAARIHASVRESDTVCRIGGDEFVILLGVVNDTQGAMQVAQHICAAVSQPIVVAERVAQVTASIGIAFYPDHGVDKTMLSRNADTAMYAAKKAGGNQWRAFSE